MILSHLLSGIDRRARQLRLAIIDASSFGQLVVWKARSRAWYGWCLSFVSVVQAELMLPLLFFP